MIPMGHDVLISRGGQKGFWRGRIPRLCGCDKTTVKNDKTNNKNDKTPLSLYMLFSIFFGDIYLIGMHRIHQYSNINVCIGS